MTFRNERNLYNRTCNLSGKPIIAMYSPENEHVVYDQAEWWGDKWNPLEYGMEFDFSKPFFAQFGALFKKVPRINLINKQHENSEYCNFTYMNRNSYALFTSAKCEDAYHSNRSWKSKSFCDSSNLSGVRTLL